MASEAQRIMNLSLTKIVSSRSRRGGVSLHRNLLVASVLFKARDVYAAEMAGLVVIRNGCVYGRTAVDDCLAQTQDLSNETYSTKETVTTDDGLATDENLIRAEQVMETIEAVVVCQFVPDSTTQEESEKVVDSGANRSSEKESNRDLESCKENIEPIDSIQNTTDDASKTVKRRRCRKVQNKQCLKRKYTEVEQAVLSITENDESGISRKMSRVENAKCGDKPSLNCGELSPTPPPKWSSDRVSENREDSEFTTSTSQDYSSCVDISENAYSSRVRDGDQPTYDEITPYQSSYCSSYRSSDYCSSTDARTFPLSRPMLVASV